MSNARLSSLLVVLMVWIVLPCRAAEITTRERVKQVGEAARSRMEPWFERQRIDYPPQQVALAVIKDDRRLKIFARNSSDDNWKFIMQYKIAKLSGKLGPKLKAGDLQVPEGTYTITHLNPNSKFWLSLALNYPNSFDRRQASRDGRTKLGGDIMIHGWWFSEGCVAMGNTASEDLFILTHDTGIDDMRVIISPTDFRQDSTDFKPPAKPAWTKELYGKLKDELNDLGTDGISKETRLVAYADIAPPPPPPTTLELIGDILNLLSVIPPVTSPADADTTSTDSATTPSLDKESSP